MMGEGNIDSSITFLGLLVGAAVSHSSGLAGSPAGVAVNGKIAVILGILFVVAVGYVNTYVSSKSKSKGMEGVSHGA